MTERTAHAITDAVILQGESVRMAANLVAYGIQHLAQQQATPPRPQWRELERLLKRTADAIELRALREDIEDVEDVLSDDPEAESISSRSEGAAGVATKEAAVLLGVSERQVRRMAFDLGATPAGRGLPLSLSRSAVLAEVQRRREAA